MRTKDLAARYIEKTEKVLKDLTVKKCYTINENLVMEVIEEAERYLKDAKFYLERGTAATSLASIAYSEGLLDALRMLGLVDFLW
ncbi:DUF357 domain-containing protein [Candidatus Bathyarchaeota archaeon]|nr:MAG: DUF357 domain-containing protein [Candidatus Bathyarchaeota archaeon]